MKYMMLIYLDEEIIDECFREKCYEESVQLTHDLKASGNYLGASPLYPVSTATCIQMREGKRIVTDGPYAETREQLGGYFLIDAADLDEAVNIAGRIPGARRGTVEVRPVIELSNMPGGLITILYWSLEYEMKYLCLVYLEEKLPGAFTEEARCCYEDLKASGGHIAAELLQPVQEATSIRMRSGTLSITNAPFCKDNEHLGGFYLIEARDLNDAIRTVSKMPPCPSGCIEVRPIQEN